MGMTGRLETMGAVHDALSEYGELILKMADGTELSRAELGGIAFKLSAALESVTQLLGE